MAQPKVYHTVEEKEEPREQTSVIVIGEAERDGHRQGGHYRGASYDRSLEVAPLCVLHGIMGTLVYTRETLGQFSLRRLHFGVGGSKGHTAKGDCRRSQLVQGTQAHGPLGTWDSLGSPLRGSSSAVIGVKAGGGGGGWGHCSALPGMPAVPVASFVSPSCICSSWCTAPASLVYLCHKGQHQMYLGIRVAAHKLGRRTGLDHLWGILVSFRGIWGGGGGCTPASAIASKRRSMASSPASIVHALFTTQTPAWRYPKWLRGISGLKGMLFIITSLLSCMGIRMNSAKWHPTV